MRELRKELSNMKPTTSCSDNEISMKAIKAGADPLAPLLLRMVNATIKMNMFPTSLKTTKVVPIRKKGKEMTMSEGWCPINIVSALSKVINLVFLRQILSHIQTNNLVSHSHHGGVRSKSTQTILTEVHDNLVESLKNGDDAALVMINQSNCFNIIDHTILIGKLKLIGFQDQTIRIMTSYLGEHLQYVQFQSKESDKLTVGPQSVIQGSTLSGAM